MFELLCKTSKIQKISIPFYIYRIRATSLSNSPDINKLKKIVSVLMDYAKFINKKLLLLTQDQYFADNIIYVVLGRLMRLFATPFIINDRIATFKALTETLTPIFKDNSAFVKTMMCSSMIGELTASNLTRENEMLKRKLQEKN